jgi:hypothetical protein
VRERGRTPLSSTELHLDRIGQRVRDRHAVRRGLVVHSGPIRRLQQPSVLPLCFPHLGRRDDPDAHHHLQAEVTVPACHPTRGTGAGSARPAVRATRGSKTGTSASISVVATQDIYRASLYIAWIGSTRSCTWKRRSDNLNGHAAPRSIALWAL